MLLEILQFRGNAEKACGPWLVSQESHPASRIRLALECDRRKNAGPTDQESGSQRNSGETYALTRVERAGSSEAKLYRAPKMDETSTGGQYGRYRHWRPIQRGVTIWPAISAKSLAAIVYCKASGELGELAVNLGDHDGSD